MLGRSILFFAIPKMALKPLGVVADRMERIVSRRAN
jgi:hypothetical protein